MATYTLEKAPYSVLKGINGDKQECHKCNAIVSFELPLFDDSDASDFFQEMDRVIGALAVQVPEEVYKDVAGRYAKFRAKTKRLLTTSVYELFWKGRL